MLIEFVENFQLEYFHYYRCVLAGISCCSVSCSFSGSLLHDNSFGLDMFIRLTSLFMIQISLPATVSGGLQSLTVHSLQRFSKH